MMTSFLLLVCFAVTFGIAAFIGFAVAMHKVYDNAWNAGYDCGHRAGEQIGRYEEILEARMLKESKVVKND